MGLGQSKPTSSTSNILSTLSVPRKSVVNQTNVLLRLAGHVSQTEAKENNLVFSPLLIHLVLSVIAAGSDGATKKQLLDFLKSSSTDELNKLSSELAHAVLSDGSGSGGPKLAFADGVWIDRSLEFKDKYKRILESVYKATSAQVDFINKPREAEEKVNSWVEKNTNSLIKQLLPNGSVDTTTRLIFTNALYFKGAWQQKFDASRTQHFDFYHLNGNSIKVPMMTSFRKQFISTYDDFKVLRLPYKQGNDNKRQFSMYVYLPEARDGLPHLVQKMSTQHGFLDKHIPRKEVDVRELRIPKFKMSFGFEASSVLKQLGVVLPFNTGGLTEMVESAMDNNLCVSSIFHKAFIEVNEEGTEAAAATAAVVMLRGAPLEIPTVDFVADHPFLFSIREDVNGVALFIGHILNPSSPA